MSLGALVTIAVILQVWDGIATYLGLSLGYAVEGNPLIRWLMGVFGVAEALALTKAGSISATLALSIGVRPPIARFALWALILFYAVIAVVPWALIFFTHPG